MSKQGIEFSLSESLSTVEINLQMFIITKHIFSSKMAIIINSYATACLTNYSPLPNLYQLVELYTSSVQQHCCVYARHKYYFVCFAFF